MNYCMHAGYTVSQLKVLQNDIPMKFTKNNTRTLTRKVLSGKTIHCHE